MKKRTQHKKYETLVKEFKVKEDVLGSALTFTQQFAVKTGRVLDQVLATTETFVFYVHTMPTPWIMCQM